MAITSWHLCILGLSHKDIRASIRHQALHPPSLSCPHRPRSCCEAYRPAYRSLYTTTQPGKMEKQSWSSILKKLQKEENNVLVQPCPPRKDTSPSWDCCLSLLTRLHGGSGHNGSLITEYNSNWCPAPFHKRSSKALWLKHHNAPGSYEGTSIIIPIYSWGK